MKSSIASFITRALIQNKRCVWKKLSTTSAVVAKGLDLISPVIGLSDDQKEFYHLAREFADSEMRPYANKWDQEAIFPVDTYKKTADLGFAGLFIPEEFGVATTAK
eukprot:gene30530-39787_t